MFLQHAEKKRMRLFCTPSYLQIYKIPKIPLRIKKIDCLTTTNLVNLKSNTMKNTLQMYGLFHLLYKIRHTKCFT